MGNIIAKFILFMIGQKLTNHENHFDFVRRKNLGAFLVCGIMAFIFFNLGVAALLIAAYQGFMILGLESIYAVLAVAAVALVLAAVFGIIVYEIVSDNYFETKKKMSLGEINPKAIAAAFIDGFLSGNSSSCTANFSKYYRKKKERKVN